MRSSFKVLTIRGINIYVHPSWLLAVAFLTWALGDYYLTKFPGWGSGTAYVLGAASAILLFVTVLIHELSHSFTARSLGLPVNEITLFIFGGVSNLTQEPQTPRVELLVALAGPVASLVLSGLFFLAGTLAHAAPSQLTAVLLYLASINLILAIFNLIPGFPLDGGRVLRAIVWSVTHNLRRATQVASTVGQIIGYLFIFGGLLEVFVLGQVVSGIWLAFIGWFLQNSASASHQQAAVDRILLGIDVADVMDRTVEAAPPTLSVEALVHQHMLGQNQRAVPITAADGRLLGLVTLQDIAGVPREQWFGTPATTVMTPASALCTVSPLEDLRAALRTLAENDYHQLPVVESGRLVGMLDRGQVLQYLHLRQQLGLARQSATAGSLPPNRRAG